MVSDRWNGHDEDFICLKNVFGLPIVTENQNYVARFELHKLRIRVQAPDQTQKPRSLLMLSHDLPLFCRVLQRALYDQPYPGNYITHLRGTPTCAFKVVTNVGVGPETKAPSLIIQLQDRATQVVTRRLLEPFRNVAFGGLNVKILNAGTTEETFVQRLQRAMSPRTVWANAVAWQMLSLLRDMATDAFDKLKAGRIGMAGIRFGNSLRTDA